MVEDVTPEEAQRTIREYLGAVTQLHRTMTSRVPEGYAYSCVEEWLQERGRFWTPQPLPKRFKRGIPQHCFHNAQRLALRSHHLRYVEGYAMSVIPLHHAWCVDEENRVIEVTWDHIAPAYFGAVFNKDELRTFRRAARTNLSILHDYERGYPLLKT